MKYETIPVEVEAFQQEIADAKYMQADGGEIVAKVGQWVFRYKPKAGGHTELFVMDDAEFKAKFRQRDRGGAEDAVRRFEELRNPRVSRDANRETFPSVLVPLQPIHAPYQPIPPTTPKCGERP